MLLPRHPPLHRVDRYRAYRIRFAPPFSNPQSPHANETEIPDPQIESQGRTPQRPPALPEEERQSYVRHTRYNEAENTLLLANVKRTGMKKCQRIYPFGDAQSPHCSTPDESEMRIVRNLSGMSNNFNQLLRLCHQHGLDAMARDVQYCLSQFRELFAKLSS